MLNEKDIIDIVQFDECGRRSIRRVQVESMRTLEDRFRIVGVNLQGRNPHNYYLPKEPEPTAPIKAPKPDEPTVHWVAVSVTEGEE